MKIRHILMAILVAAIWGGNFVVVKIGLSEIPPFIYGAGRFCISALPVFFIKKPNVPWKIILGISISLGVCKFTLMFMGIHLGVSAGLASLLMQSQMFFTLAFSLYFFQSKVLPNHIFGILLACFGMFLIGWQMNAESSLIGFLFIIMAAFSWGFSNILFRKAGNVDMFALTVWTSVIPPIPLLLGELAYEGMDPLIHSLSGGIGSVGVLCLLYTACASTWIGGTLWGVLLRTYEPHRVAPFSLLIPIFGITFATLVLEEEVNMLVAVACCLVFLGLLINQWPVSAKMKSRLLGDARMRQTGAEKDKKAA